MVLILKIKKHSLLWCNLKKNELRVKSYWRLKNKMGTCMWIACDFLKLKMLILPLYP